MIVFWVKQISDFGPEIRKKSDFPLGSVSFSDLTMLFRCSLEQRNLELETEMVSLHEELDQERKKYTMAEIKLRNAERAKDDAERRNQMLQKEMEQFFSTFSDLTATGANGATDPRRPDRNNPIWIQ